MPFKKQYLFLVLFLFATVLQAQENGSYRFGILRYNGGGDWYSNPTSVPNLSAFCTKELNMQLNEPEFVEVGSPELFNFPFIHMTGHGNVVFNPAEAENLRNYLLGGGFLHIDDNYGMDKFIRTELKKVFPDKELEELPPSHPIFQQKFPFPQGLPKIHEHDNQRAQGFGIIHEGRVICFYTYETDLGDGWEDAAVHNNSEETRLKALRMGANIVQYAFSRE